LLQEKNNLVFGFQVLLIQPAWEPTFSRLFSEAEMTQGVVNVFDVLHTHGSRRNCDFCDIVWICFNDTACKFRRTWKVSFIKEIFKRLGL